MSKKRGPFATRVRLILQACLADIKPGSIEDIIEQIDKAAKDSGEIREHYRTESKGPPTD